MQLQKPIFVQYLFLNTVKLIVYTIYILHFIRQSLQQYTNFSRVCVTSWLTVRSFCLLGELNFPLINVYREIQRHL